MLDRAKGMGFMLLPLSKVPLMVAGSLATFINTLEVLTQDSWVSQTVKKRVIERSKLDKK